MAPDKAQAYAWISLVTTSDKPLPPEAQQLADKALGQMDAELAAEDLARAKDLAREYAEKYRRAG
ncbi:hypothetical protein D3C81_2156560 [compost metagenome]